MIAVSISNQDRKGYIYKNITLMDYYLYRHFKNYFLTHTKVVGTLGCPLQQLAMLKSSDIFGWGGTAKQSDAKWLMPSKH